MKKTLTEMRAELTALTTKARDEYRNAEEKAKVRIRLQYPSKDWTKHLDLIKRDIEVQKAKERLSALCDACIIFKADMGE